MQQVLTDEELMAKYIQGDFQSFADLYLRHGAKVNAYISKRILNKQEAQELFQTVFMKCHTSKENYDPKYPVLQWLFVICKTSLIDHYRLNGRQIPTIYGMSSDEIDKKINHQSSAAHESNYTDSVQLLKSLSKEEQELVQSRILDEETYEVISKRLKKSEVSVRQSVSRALKKLRTQFLLEEVKK